MTTYEPANERYRSMQYRNVGRSGLKPHFYHSACRILPLRLHSDPYRKPCVRHLTMASLILICANYGPPYGSQKFSLVRFSAVILSHLETS